MDNYEANGVNLSRYIASWLNAGGSRDDIPIAWSEWEEKYYAEKHEQLPDFIRWLSYEEALTTTEICDICQLAWIGKLELEQSAKKFIRA